MQRDRLLVTGGAGFIGANFVHYWLDRHPEHRLVVLDSLTYAGNRSSLDAVRGRANFRFVQGDILDEALVENILREERINAIVHFAAESHVDRSILGPDQFLQTNVMGTHALLKAARQAWAEAGGRGRFHHVSTDEVYGSLGVDDAPFREDTPFRPNSPYAASKAASDHLVRAYHHTYGLDVTISNCSNNYGRFQFPEKLVPLMIINALEGKELPVYGDGRNVRDWLHVEDHCRGIELVLERGRSGETYNIGGGSERANIDLVQDICSRIDSALEADPQLRRRFPAAPPSRGGASHSLIRYVRDRPGHDFRYAIGDDKVRRECGYAPRYSLGQGLSETIGWYLGNESWWRGVMDQSYRNWIDLHYGAGN